MALPRPIQSELVLWITFPDFLSSGWIAQQELVVLNTLERIYGREFDQGWRQVSVSRKGAALVIQGLDPAFIAETQKALLNRGLEVSVRAADQADHVARLG